MAGIRIAIVAGMLVMLASPVHAHQPRLPEPGVTVVSEPDVSQAFYGVLGGSPGLYRVEVPESMLLYVGLLVPNLPYVTRDLSALLYRETDSGEQALAFLGGDSAKWVEFFEPFAGDDYYQGPETRVRVGPGTYMVRVTRPGNTGKYVLAIGERERFTPAEIARSVKVIAKLKRDFFDKPSEAVFNRFNLILGAGAAVVVGAVVLVILLATRR